MADIVRFEKGVTRNAVRVMALLEKRAAQKADRVFVPSEYAAKTLHRYYEIPSRKISIMHNGIFFDEWTAAVDAAQMDNNRPPTVLAVARLYRRKGIDGLIRAWPKVLARVNDARLRIAGGGLEYENLKNLADELGLAESVHFTGDVRGRDEMAALYANCDVFCLPSRHETFGLVYLEAMAAGKPVVALNTTAVPEVVRDGVDGVLVDEGDAGKLADAITFLLENPTQRARMGQSGKERVKTHFSWTKVIEPIIEWLVRDRNRLK